MSAIGLRVCYSILAPTIWYAWVHACGALQSESNRLFFFSIAVCELSCAFFAAVVDRREKNIIGEYSFTRICLKYNRPIRQVRFHGSICRWYVVPSDMTCVNCSLIGKFCYLSFRFAQVFLVFAMTRAVLLSPSMSPTLAFALSTLTFALIKVWTKFNGTRQRSSLPDDLSPLSQLIVRCKTLLINIPSAAPSSSYQKTPKNATPTPPQ